MLYIHLTALAGFLLFALVYFPAVAPAHNQAARRAVFARAAVLLLFGAALAVRLIAARLSPGNSTDMSCFAAWADRIFQTGPSGFYSSEVFTDYPPGYMYLLYPIGALRSFLGLDYHSPLYRILLRLPAILCDLGLGAVLYSEARRRNGHEKAVVFAAAYLLNPAVILNSSVWGQVDAVLTLPLVCMCLSIMREKLVPAYLFFCAALLLKPQALFLAPILFLGMLNQLVLKDFSVRRLLRSLAFGIASLCGTVLLCAPFGLNKVWNQLFSTVSSYPYASVNAYNFWSFAGLDWVSQDNTFLGIPYHAFGFAALLAAVAVTLYLGIRRRKDSEQYALLSAVLLVNIFMFSVRMHERYLFPALSLLLLACIYRPTRRLFFCYGGFSLLHLYNTAHVLYFYDASDFDRHDPVILLTSLGMLIMTCCLYQTLQGADSVAPRALPAPRSSVRPGRLTAADFACMIVITVLYGCFALHDLGDRQAPVSACDMTGGQSLEFDFGDRIPARFSYYIAPWHDRVFALEGRRSADEGWTALGEVTLENVFTWKEITVEAGVPYLRLTLQDNQASLLELVFEDADGNAILPVNAQEYPALFDEQELFPEYVSFRNSMYFDEIYHGRTAYEFLRGIPAYENTHPPLGKIFIAAGVALFGMNPFGWRIMGTLFGIAMVPVVYLFAKRMTSRTACAALACVLFAFDFMHFAQTRIATIDVYITFFVILMYYFMYRYSTVSFYDTPLKKTLLPLGACGVCMGLGIASKWTGIYAAVGLAVIFFSVLLRRYREYLYAKSDPEGATDGISHAKITGCFRRCTITTLLFCVGFFVLVPAVIYLLSYLPFRDYTEDGLFLRMLHNQTSMFRYHSTLDATHPYSSPWYEWPIMVRPIWYYAGYPGGDLREGISAFGNPLVWWAGIPAFLYMLRLWAAKKDRTAAFLTVGYLAQLLPWVFVSRITFIYHYFPCVIFIVLMIVHALETQKKRLTNRRFLILLALYGTAAFVLFLMFYPVLSGRPVNASYVNRWLRWFDSWVLAGK